MPCGLFALYQGRTGTAKVSSFGMKHCLYVFLFLNRHSLYLLIIELIYFLYLKIFDIVLIQNNFLILLYIISCSPILYDIISSYLILFDVVILCYLISSYHLILSYIHNILNVYIHTYILMLFEYVKADVLVFLMLCQKPYPIAQLSDGDLHLPFT